MLIKKRHPEENKSFDTNLIVDEIKKSKEAHNLNAVKKKSKKLIFINLIPPQ